MTTVCSKDSLRLAAGGKTRDANPPTATERAYAAGSVPIPAMVAEDAKDESFEPAYGPGYDNTENAIIADARIRDNFVQTGMDDPMPDLPCGGEAVTAYALHQMSMMHGLDSRDAMGKSAREKAGDELDRLRKEFASKSEAIKAKYSPEAYDKLYELNDKIKAAQEAYGNAIREEDNARSRAAGIKPSTR